MARKKKRPTRYAQPSEAKSLIARTRPRGLGGKFLSADPEAAAQKKLEVDTKRILTKGFNETDLISEEDRAYFGKDSRKFLERALEKAPTWYEGLKVAKELKPIQHPTLQAVQSKVETTVTHKKLQWAWEPVTEIVGTTVEELTDTTSSSLPVLEALDVGALREN